MVSSLARKRASEECKLPVLMASRGSRFHSLAFEGERMIQAIVYRPPEATRRLRLNPPGDRGLATVVRYHSTT
ncbi:hypothetical protein SAMN05444166_3197 [Singulisphaera sp. GP187]|nr:hypothetical protein SAMN05444166_3197 [Singulisphaera sp. GP187]